MQLEMHASFRVGVHAVTLFRPGRVTTLLAALALHLGVRARVSHGRTGAARACRRYSLLYTSPAMDRATKSTFFLADSRRAQLKSIAVEHRTTVTELLAEG